MTANPGSSLNLARADAYLLRAPVERPMLTAFARLTARTSLIVRLEDRDGAVGWGEIYASFPSGSGEHRLNLLRAIFLPALAGRDFAGPEELYDHLTARTRVLSLQTGEPGPFAQCVSGLDIAAWDLVARRSGRTLAEALGGGRRDSVAAYLSGLDPDGPEKLAAAGFEAGHRAFKMKLGFGRDRDLRNAEAMRETLGPDTPVAMDVNQVWDAEETVRMAPRLAAFGPLWLEEPLAADTPFAVWQALARDVPIPLAAGENMRGEAVFDEAIACGAFAVLQPDPIKWGGLSALRRVVRRVTGAGLRFCPHFLGGGIGLLASAHLAAGCGGESTMVEVDQNENPLREMLAQPFPRFVEGRMQLPQTPGLGIEPDLLAAKRHLVADYSERLDVAR